MPQDYRLFSGFPADVLHDGTQIFDLRLDREGPRRRRKTVVALEIFHDPELVRQTFSEGEHVTGQPGPPVHENYGLLAGAVFAGVELCSGRRQDIFFHGRIIGPFSAGEERNNL